MFYSLLKIVIAIFLFLVVLGAVRTWQMEHSPNQKNFLAGKVGTLPSGLYKGTLPGHTVSWRGKKFDSANSSGINVFDDGNGGTVDKYSFKTSLGKGIRDSKTDVIKIDYNISDNPFWLRAILDEIVEVAPGSYLGKWQFRFLPGYPFTLAFFELNKH